MQNVSTSNAKPEVALEQLVNAIGAGDNAMECEFYERFHRQTLRYLSSYTSDTARAEDIAHDTLLKVLLQLRRRALNKPASLGGFVRQTAKYSVLEWRRLKANQEELKSSFDDSHTIAVEHDQWLARREQLATVKKFIKALPVPRDREVLLRTYHYEECKSSICEALDLDSKNFDRVLSRAKKRLSTSLTEAGRVFSDFSDALSD
jgi:RNA polymerase sigma factor (sigma-70 family)